MLAVIRFCAGAAVATCYAIAVGAAFAVVLLTVNGAGWAVSQAFDALLAAVLR